MPQTLTAVLITKNEAAQIRSCLDAIRWTDEIVVVDGESTDGTPEICRSYGAKVITHPFEGSFAKERNLGTDHATSDWILQLDADDRVTDAFREAALAILRDGTPYAAFRFRRVNRFLGHWMSYGGWQHDSLHYFKRGKARYQGRVHEELVVDGPIGHLAAPIEHHPFKDFAQFWARQNRYTTLEAMELAAKQGILSEKAVRTQLLVRPLKLFFKIYVKKGGFREGMHGFLFAGMFAFVHFLKWAKYWELTQVQRS